MYEFDSLVITDTLVLSINGRLDSLLSDSLLSIQNNPAKLVVEIIVKRNSTLSPRFELIDKKQLVEEISILATHSEFLKRDLNNFGLTDVYRRYQNNPFLAPFLPRDLDVGSSLFINNPEWGGNLYNQETIQRLDSFYNWQDILYKDSTLELKNKVSYKDVTENYRESVTNSANALRLVAENNHATQKQSGSLLDANTILIGLSDFLEERAQEELNITFLDRFKKNLRESGELNILFPRTLTLFEQFEISNYRTLLENAQPVFKSDLSEIAINFPKLLNLPKYADLYNSPEVYNLVFIYSIANMVYRDTPVDTILLQSFADLHQRSVRLHDTLNATVARRILSDTTTAPAYVLDLQNLSAKYSKGLIASRDTLDDIKSELGKQRDSINTEMASLSLNRGIWNEEYKRLDRQVNRGSPAPAFPDSRLYPYDLQANGPTVYRQYIDANLQGKQFYGYLRQLEGLEEYDRYFSKKAKPSDLSFGALSLLEQWLDADSPGKLLDWRQSLSDAARQTLELKLKVVNYKLKLTRLQRQFEEMMGKRSALNSAIQQELLFWSAQDGIDSFYLASMDALSAGLSTGLPTWRSVNGQLRRAQSRGITIDSIVNSGDQQPLVVLDDANTLINGIRQRLDQRLGELQSVFPGVSPPANPFFRTLDSLSQIEEQLIRQALAPVERLEDRLAASADSLQLLQSRWPDSIRTELAQLQKQYGSGDIIRSIDNANNLGQILEFTINLLYSLKDGSSHQVSRTVTNAQTGQVVNQLVLETQKWMSRDQFVEIMRNDTSQAALLGLIYQRLVSLKGFPNISSEATALWTTKFLNSIYDLGDIRRQLEAKKDTVKNLEFNDYYPFIKVSVDLINTVITTPYRDTTTLVSGKPILGVVPVISNEALTLYENIYAGNYGKAIYNTMELFKTITDVYFNRLIEKKTALAKNKMNKDKDLREINGKIRRFERIRNAILLYGTFMAEIVDAKNSNDVKLALRAAALPPGSSRIKRETTFNISLNAYFSLAGGTENLQAGGGEAEQSGKGWFGLSVPVGISFSKGFANKSGGGVSLHVSLLDIGAITAFRLDDSAETLPELEFRNFFAPGLIGFYNFKNSPFSLGAGWQYGPQQRKISDTSTGSQQGSRWLFSLGIDLPIFNFYTGPKTITTQDTTLK